MTLWRDPDASHYAEYCLRNLPDEAPEPDPEEEAAHWRDVDWKIKEAKDEKDTRIPPDRNEPSGG